MIEYLLLGLQACGYLLGGLIAAYCGFFLLSIADELKRKLVTAAFEYGMRLKRKRDAGDLGPLGMVWGHLYVFAFFLPLDFLYNFDVYSRQAQQRPRFELTTSAIGDHLHDKPGTKHQTADRMFVVANRALQDEFGKTPLDAIRANVALQHFDLIDTRAGDLTHFDNPNQFRSENDPDRAA